MPCLMSFSFLRAVGLLLFGGLLAAPATAQSWQTLSLPGAGSSGTLTVLASAFSPAGPQAGEVIVAGTFTGTVVLGSSTLTSAGGLDIFVARLTQGGGWIRAVRAGGPDADQATGLAVTVSPNHDVIVCGQFAGPVLTLGPTTLTNTTPGTTDVFVGRLNAALDWLGGAQLSGAGDDFATGVGISNAGAITVVGSFRSATLQAGALPMTNAGVGTHDAFVARYAVGGTWDQAVRVGGSGDELAGAVDVTIFGEAVVAGSFASPAVSFGATALTNAEPAGQEADAFVARLSPAGQWTQAVRAGAVGGDYLRAVRFDNAGGVVVAGDFTGATTAFGPTTLANADASGNSSDLLVARLSAGGTWTQATGAGSAGLDYATGLALDGLGGAVVVGSFYGPSLPLGGATLTNAVPGAASFDVFVGRLSPAGAWTQATRAGEPPTTTPRPLPWTRGAVPTWAGWCPARARSSARSPCPPVRPPRATWRRWAGCQLLSARRRGRS